MNPNGSFNLNFLYLDALNLSAFFMFIILKYVFRHKDSIKKKQFHYEVNSREQVDSNHFTTGMTPIWTKKSLDNDFFVIKMLCLNLYIYFFSPLILIYILLRSVIKKK